MKTQHTQPMGHNGGSYKRQVHSTKCLHKKQKQNELEILHISNLVTNLSTPEQEEITPKE